MIEEILSVRELKIGDIDLFASYWLNSDEFYLANMGVDIKKLPTKDEIFSYWKLQLEMPIENRLSYCIIWQKNNIPIGHSSTRPTYFGKEAHMHLHLWNKLDRGKGMGYELVKLTVRHLFERLNLMDLYCEPYALNPAPNELLKKVGFDFVKEYMTVPGPSNFEQKVKLWHLSARKFKNLQTGT
ncbi:MAG: GNAT family protein [Ferruginibacter sp.]